MKFPSLKSRWFAYSILCVFCWGAWALLAKLGSREISAEGSQFLFAWGAVPVAVLLLAARGWKLEKNLPGIGYSVANGILSGVGGWALFAAYRTGGNTSIITTVTAMYPLISVMLAVAVLRERLTRLHVLGLAFAAVAFIIFSS